MSSFSHDHHRPPKGGRGATRPPPPSPATPGNASPCGACKFLRRKCVAGCVFAPHFATEQGAAKFAAVHKVFGASNVSKLLSRLPAARRHDAVVTVCYEAQARLADPVYGCVATVLALQQQVAALQAELSVVQAQLINSRLAVANSLQSTHNDGGTAASMQPSHSNTSSTSNDLTTIFPTLQPRYDFTEATSTMPLSISPPPLLPCLAAGSSREEEEEEEVSRNAIAFVDGMFPPQGVRW